MVQHEGRTLLISTDSMINLTNYITLKLFSYQIQLHEILFHSAKRKNEVITTGTFTRAYYLRIKNKHFLP